MKKSIKQVFAFLALVLTVTSCGDYLEMPDIIKNILPDSDEEPVVGDVVFHGTTETLANWEKGDKISLFDGKSVSVVENSANSGTVAEFKKVVPERVPSWLLPSNREDDRYNCIGLHPNSADCHRRCLPA